MTELCNKAETWPKLRSGVMQDVRSMARAGCWERCSWHEAGLGRNRRGRLGLTVPIWGVPRAVSHLGKGCIKTKITWCHSVPAACSQSAKGKELPWLPFLREDFTSGTATPERGSPGAGGCPGSQSWAWGRAGGAVRVWSAMRVPHGCHRGAEQWPWARGAACTRLRSFCGGTSFDINIFLLSTRPTFQTMPLASRLPHSSSAVLPQPAPHWHPRQHGTRAVEW